MESSRQTGRKRGRVTEIESDQFSDQLVLIIGYKIRSVSWVAVPRHAASALTTIP